MVTCKALVNILIIITKQVAHEKQMEPEFIPKNLLASAKKRSDLFLSPPPPPPPPLLCCGSKTILPFFTVENEESLPCDGCKTEF